MVRRLFDEATAAQAQYTHTSTSDGYTKGCRRWKCPTDTVSLGGGAKVHWIGKRNAQYVLLYFHGMFLSCSLDMDLVVVQVADSMQGVGIYCLQQEDTGNTSINCGRK